jgi:hypothetical protein
MKTCVSLLQYVAELFLGREMFQKNVEKNKTFLCSIIFPEKLCWAPQATEDNKILRMRFACRITKAIIETQS